MTGLWGLESLARICLRGWQGTPRITPIQPRQNNVIQDAGLISFASFCCKGALPKLRFPSFSRVAAPVPCTLLRSTTISTLPAFMTWEVGERLGYGITLILVIETAKTTMAEVLPTCGELH